MIYLLCISHTAQVIFEEQVQGILQSAQRNDLALDITGVIVHGGDQFM